MGREYARTRLGVDEPRLGLLSNGEEAGQGRRRCASACTSCSQTSRASSGNVEGRDFMRPGIDVIVTDGFTGNVALKTIEGAIRGTASLVFGVLELPELRDAAAVVMPHLLEAAKGVDPDYVGGVVLLGVQGVCVIAHGSSSAMAIVGAARQAVECVEAEVVERMKEAIARCRLRPTSSAARSDPTRCCA